MHVATELSACIGVFLELYFGTSNESKYEEARKILERADFTLKHFCFKHNEIRSDSLKEIACEAVLAAYSTLKKPVFVEDAGLFICSLNDFPGTYSAWIYRKIGIDGILQLLKTSESRAAAFRAVVAYTCDGSKVQCFDGQCNGSIAMNKKGNSGFGYDPIFIPDGYDNTFAENIALKNKLSHRYTALLKLSKYLRNPLL